MVTRTPPRQAARYRTSKRLNLSLTLLAVACVCTACATRSYTPDTPSEARQLNIRYGDEIRVVTTNRERLTLKVQTVLEDRVVGVTIEPNVKDKRPPGIGVEVAYADIAMLETCNASIGCAYRPMIQRPAEAVRPEYASYDCSQLDAAILKIDTVRWVIRDDGGELETSGHKAARYAGNFLMIPLSLGAGGGPFYMTDDGHLVLNAADYRILELLRLKRARGCPAAATSEPGMTDLQMLEVLESLMPATGSPDRQTCDDRTALLDRLRAPLPASPGSGLPRE
jgi:hypothetical protein